MIFSQYFKYSGGRNMKLRHNEKWISFFRDLKEAIAKKKVPNRKDKFGNYLIAHDSKDTYFVMLQHEKDVTLIVSDLCEFVGKENRDKVLETFRGIFGQKVKPANQFLNNIDYIIDILVQQE